MKVYFDLIRCNYLKLQILRYRSTSMGFQIVFLSGPDSLFFLYFKHYCYRVYTNFNKVFEVKYQIK